MASVSQLIRARVFGGGVAAVSPMSAGATRVLRGLRQGDQSALLSGAILVAYGLWRRRGPERELLVRREVPIGTTLVIRHGREGEIPQIRFYERDAG